MLYIIYYNMIYYIIINVYYIIYYLQYCVSMKLYYIYIYIISHFTGGKHWNCLDPMVDCSN